MKKQYLLFALLAFAIPALSQTSTGFGIRGGITSSGMRGDAMNNLKGVLDFTNGMVTTQNHTGFFGGGYVSIPVAGAVAIEPALYYAQKGYEMRGAVGMKGVEFLNANATARLVTQYIDMPVLVKANFGGLQVFAGPQVSYLANADLKTSAGILGINLLKFNTNATNQFNRWDAALTGGVGYQFENGFNVMASYDHGLVKADANRRLQTYNQSVKVGVGIKL